MSEDKQKVASMKIAEILKEIDKLYKSAAVIAEDAQINFRYSGPAGYGDSGWYTPKGVAIQEAKEYDDEIDEDWEISEEDYGWCASSGSC